MQLHPYRHDIYDPRLADVGLLDRVCGVLRSLRRSDDVWLRRRSELEYQYVLLPSAAIEHEDLNGIRRLITGLSIVNMVSNMFGIVNLEIDPTGWGSGFHVYPVGGYVGWHIDPALHPTSLRQRRVTAVMFLVSGAVCLWDGRVNVSRIELKAGEILLFENSDTSYWSVDTCSVDRYVFTASYYTSPVAGCSYRTRSLWVSKHEM